MPSTRGKRTPSARPRRVCSSDRLRPNSSTLMRTHPGWGSGIDNSWICRFSTGPGALSTTAFMLDLMQSLWRKSCGARAAYAVDDCILNSGTSRGCLRCERVVLARGGGDARQGGFNGRHFIVPDMRGKMASDAVLMDGRRALQRLLAARGEHDEQAAAIPGRRSALHEASLLDPIDYPRQTALAE